MSPQGAAAGLDGALGAWSVGGPTVAGAPVGGPIQRVELDGVKAQANKAMDAVDAAGTATVDWVTGIGTGIVGQIPDNVERLLGPLGKAGVDSIGWLFAGKTSDDLTADLIAQIVGNQGREAIKRLLMAAGDYLAAPVVQQAQSLWSWGVSAITPTFVSSLASAVQAYAVPVLGWITTVEKYFSKLPESLRAVIVFGVARGLRGFLGWSLGEESWGESLDGWMDTLFAGSASQTLQALIKWYGRFTTEPVSVAVEMWGHFRHGQPLPGQKAEGEQPDDTDEQTGEGSGTSGGSVDKTPGGVARRRIDKPLADLDVKFLRVQVGAPRLMPKAAVQQAIKPPSRSQKPSDLDVLSETKDEQKEAMTRPGGLVMPFNLGLNLFGVELSAEQRNELALPWNGGFSLVVPHVGLKAPSGPLAGLFGQTELYADDLYIDQEGLQTLTVGVRGLSFGDVLKVDALEGAYHKEKGFKFEADGTLNLSKGDPKEVGKAKPKSIRGRFELGLDKEGKFSSAGFSIGSPGAISLVEGLSLESPTFSGRFAKQAPRVQLAFQGGLKGSIADLVEAKLEKGFVAYESASGDPKKGGFHMGAGTLSIGIGKRGTAFIEAGVHDVVFSSNKALRRFGGASLAADASKSFTVPPVLSFPIMIVPGIEAFVDMDIGGNVHAGLSGSFKKLEPGQSVWVAEGKATAGAEAHIGVKAGVQVGSQLAAALAVGLKAGGHAELEGSGHVKGGVTFEDFKLRAAESAPLEAGYTINGQVIAKAGLIIEARALHVLRKTLYERTFIEWKMGSFSSSGTVRYQRGADGEGVWKVEPDESKTGFGGEKGGLPKGEQGSDGIAPNHFDTPIEQADIVRLLTSEAPIGESAEARKAVITETTAKFLELDKTLGAQLDRSSRALAAARSNQHRLKGRFLSSLRFGKERRDAAVEVARLTEETRTLHTRFREVNLILVGVDKAISAASKIDLEAGKVDLASMLEEAHRAGALLTESEQAVAAVTEDALETETLSKAQ